ncbi:MAG: hypothetical protein QXH42_07620 [Thermoplasmata archaeon]
MPYRLPGDELVADAVRRALEGRKTMLSQREFRERVLQELRKSDPGLTISGPRLRRLALTRGLVRVEISWRATDRKVALFNCPVCGTRLRPTRNETVFGGTVTLGFRCPTCPFRSSVRRREPTRYVFTRRE